MEKIHHTWTYESDANVLDDYALTTTTSDGVSDGNQSHVTTCLAAWFLTRLYIGVKQCYNL